MKDRDEAIPPPIGELAPAPATRGGLIIIEYHFPWFFRQGVGTYFSGGFLELYNDSDATIYLDGKLVGMAHAVAYVPSSSTRGRGSSSGLILR